MIGVITGSGTYALPGFQGEPREVETRFGQVTATVGTFAGVDVAHVSRHEPGHARLSNHVRHQANVSAMQALGVRAAIGVTVCGAVDPGVELGSLIVFDDLHFLANRLPSGEICTLHDTPAVPGRGHWVFEGPFSAAARAALLTGAREAGHGVRDGGCYGHVDGPRFNTRAEIRTLAQVGVTAVSQTAGPETTLFGEAAIPYGLLGYATDYANGVQEEATPVEELMRLIGASTATFAATLAAGVPVLATAELEPVGTTLTFD